MPKNNAEIFIKLSAHKKEEKDTGYLVCEDCILGSTGWLEYYAKELDINTVSPMTKIRVYRSAEELFNPDSMDTLEHKAVTIHHPKDFVNVENDQYLRKGTIYNVHRDGELLKADIIITDEKAKTIMRKIKCLSLGYKFNIVPLSDTEFAMKDIIYNHIALVERGRSKVARVQDCAIEIENKNGGINAMGLFNTKKADEQKAVTDSADIFEMLKTKIANGEITLDSIKPLFAKDEDKKADDEDKEDDKKKDDEKESEDECASKDEDKDDEKDKKDDKSDEKSEKKAKDSVEEIVDNRIAEALEKIAQKMQTAKGNDNEMFKANDTTPAPKADDRDVVLKNYFESTLNVHKNKDYKKECGSLSTLIK